jgi:hypothetical protein
MCAYRMYLYLYKYVYVYIYRYSQEPYKNHVRNHIKIWSETIKKYCRKPCKMSVGNRLCKYSWKAICRVGKHINKNVLDLVSNPSSLSRSLNSSSRHPPRALRCQRQPQRSLPLATHFRSKFAYHGPFSSSFSQHAANKVPT